MKEIRGLKKDQNLLAVVKNSYNFREGGSQWLGLKKQNENKLMASWKFVENIICMFWLLSSSEKWPLIWVECLFCYNSGREFLDYNISNTEPIKILREYKGKVH